MTKNFCLIGMKINITPSEFIVGIYGFYYNHDSLSGLIYCMLIKMRIIFLLDAVISLVVKQPLWQTRFRPENSNPNGMTGL